jgi:hypothetical protein
MHEFELPVTCNEKEYLLPAAYLPSGYTHRIRVMIEALEVFFEPDEEGSYRAITAPENVKALEKTDKALLAAIIRSIEFVFSGK